ncbi:MAG TPA: IS630 family transposase [Acetobacteraceae bacterium]|jgi:transposase|nr:IS630 family transposase [Acetobacteraceae bacterium]
MVRPIEVSRKDHSPAALREIARSTDDSGVVRRLQAIAAVLEGHSRGEAAHLNGMERQTLRDWVHRDNEHGVAGLTSRQSPGRPSALTEAQMEELRQLVLAGPDLERHGVVRWRCADLRKEIAARWSITVHENTVGRFLHRLEMTRLQPRPQHPKTDTAAQEDFKKTSLAWSLKL